MISVICPVYNDLEGLKTTIKSLLEQDFDDYEIIIGDNNSHDGTFTQALIYSASYPHVKTTIEEQKSSYANRNKALEEAKGDIIAFIDGDMSVPENWLSKIHNHFNNNNTEYLGCHVTLYSTKDNYVSRYNKFTGFPIKQYIKNSHYSPTCSLIVRSYIFDKVGKFDSRLISNGDWEFGQRVRDNGFVQHYASHIVMYHPAKSSFISLSKKYRRIGKGFYQSSIYHPERENRLHEHLKNIPLKMLGKPTLEPNPIDETQLYKKSGIKEKIIYQILDKSLKGSIVLGYYEKKFLKV